jgi:hypothetical protein
MRSPIWPKPPRAWRVDWSPDTRVPAFHRIANAKDGMGAVYVTMYMHWESLDFEFAKPTYIRWKMARPGQHRTAISG